MTFVRSSQDFVRALKSATDPPSVGAPLKIDIATHAWNDVSFYVPSKAQVIAEWILTKLLKEKEKDRACNPILDSRYWKLLANVIHPNNHSSDPRPLKAWLGAILIRVPIAPIVISYLTLHAQRRTLQEELSHAVATCLFILWPLGVQKASTENLLECLGASLPLVKNSSADKSIPEVVNLITNSYRNSLANNSNKRKLFNLFLQHHFRTWLECVAHASRDETHVRLLGSVYNAGVETMFSLDVLRQALDSKSENVLFSSFRDLVKTSKFSILSVLPQLFSSFLQAMKKYRASLFGQGSNQQEINAAGLRFFATVQSLLDVLDSSAEVWKARNALLDIARETNLLTQSPPETEHSLHQICQFAIASLLNDDGKLAIDCLSMLARIDLDIVLQSLPLLLPKLLQVAGCQITHGSSSPTSFLEFLDLLLDYYAKTRTIPIHISNLLDIALSPKQVASAGEHDSREIYQWTSGSILLHPTHLDRLTKKVQSFITPTQILQLAQSIAERLGAAWTDLETAARQICKPHKRVNTVNASPEILAVRFSLLTTLANVVLSSLPVRSLPSGERTALNALLNPLRHDLVAKVVRRLRKKLRDEGAWEWQICAAAALRMRYVLGASRNLGLPDLEDDSGFTRKVAELAENSDLLPELSFEAFRYILSKTATLNPTQTNALLDGVLTYVEQRLSPARSRWSGYTYQLTHDEKGKVNSALALLHILIGRWLPIVDAYTSAEHLKRFVDILLSIGLDGAASQHRTELVPKDVLLMALRSAQFWELPNIRPVFLCFLTDSTSVLDSPSDAVTTHQAISLYELILYVPTEYLSKPSRTELVKRALAADMLLYNETKMVANSNISHLHTVLRVFLKRIFGYTGFVEPSVLGLAGFLEHLMSSMFMEDAAVNATLELIRLYFRELLKNAERGNTDILRVFNRMVAWTASDTSTLENQGVINMIELAATESSINRLSEEIKAKMISTHEQLIASIHPRMIEYINQSVISDSQGNLISLWSSLLSLGHRLGRRTAIELFGWRLASRVVTAPQGSTRMDETKVVVLALMIQELQCLPEDEQTTHLEQIVGVYLSFASVIDPKNLVRLDGYMSRAFKSVFASNYAHHLDLVAERLASSPSEGMAMVVHLATRSLKDYPQNTLKHTQAYTTRCINTFAAHNDIFVNGQVDVRISVLDFVVQLCSERPAGLRSSDLNGIWHLVSQFLGPSRVHDDETSTVIYHRIVSAVGALVRLRRDLIASTLPHLAMTLRQLNLCMRACRPMLGAKQTTIVMDTLPRWISAKQALGVEEAKALSRLMESLNTKTVVRAHTRNETQKAESLAKPFSKHAVYVIMAYIECMNDPLCIMSREVRRELEPGLFILCGMVSEYGRDAVMVSALDSGGKAVMKGLWGEYEKQKYVGQG